MSIKQEIWPTGGINLDDDPQFLPEGDYLELRNAHNGVTEEGHLGNIETIKGNTLVTEIALPSGTNTVIGGCPDISNYTYIYFIYNSLGNHSIYAVSGINKSTIAILKSKSILNFNPDYKIHSANVLNGYLYWTDNYNPPRRINIEKARKHTAGEVGGYSTITEQILDVVNYPPLEPPSVRYSSDYQRKRNLLRGRLFKFSYRYIYEDYGKSTWSPWSIVPLPLGDTNADGSFVIDQTHCNVIMVQVNIGSNEVIKIEIAYSIDNGTTFYQAGVIHKYDNNGNWLISSERSYRFSFYNDVVSSIIDMDDFVRPFDFIPLKAETQDVLKETILAYGGITEGYDNVTADLKVEPEYTMFDGNYYDIVFQTSIVQFQGVAQIKFDFTQIDFTHIPGVLELNYSYFQSVNPNYVTGTLYVYSNAGDTITQFVSHFIEVLGTVKIFGFNVFSVYNNWYTDNLVYVKVHHSIPFIVITGISFTDCEYSEYNTLAYKSWKSGTNITVGIQYHDEKGKIGTINTCDDANIYIPSFNDQYIENFYPSITGEPFPYDVLPKTSLKVSVKHTPPDWASKYQLVVSYPPLNFIQYVGDLSLNGSNPKLKINLNDKISHYNETIENSILTQWTFEKGDRIRIIAKKTTNSVYLFLNSYDYEIDSVDDDAVIFFRSSFFASNISQFPKVLVEVYRPLKYPQEAKVYYEVGKIYDIGEDVYGLKYHKGDTQDQSIESPSFIPAICSLDGGNVYIKYRNLGDNIGENISPIEDVNYCDFYVSNIIDNGRPNIENDLMRQRRYEIVRHGGRYIETTQVNLLSSFESDAYIQLPEKYGPICKIVERGNVLKVLQESKLTNIDIAARELKSLSGGILTTTDSVLGSIRPSQSDYGCIDPCSVILHHSYLYFYDRINGCIIRDGGDGPFEISKYKISSYVKTLSDNISKSGLPVLVLGVIDNRYDQYMIQFICKSNILMGDPVTVDYSENFVFQEQQNRWKESVDLYTDAPGIRQYIEWVGSVGDYLFTFMDGMAWMHHINDTYMNFFGEQKQFKLKVSGNINPGIVKDFNSITIYTNNTKYLAENDSYSFLIDPIDIPATMINPSMRSRIKPVKFNHYEGRLEAEFLRDITTPMSGTDIEKLLNGRVLKGTHILLTLKHSNPDLVLLNRVTISSSPSDVTK